MRKDDHGLRVAIATLYVRVRNARRLRTELLHTHGAMYPAYLSADAQYVATHNDLQAVIANAYGKHPVMDGHAFLKAAKLSALTRARRQAA